MEKNIWIISQSNSHILTQIITDNFMLLGLLDRLKIINDINDKDGLDEILKGVLPLKNPVIYYIFEDKFLSDAAKSFCESNEINSVDVHRLAFSFFYRTISSSMDSNTERMLSTEINKDFINFAIEADDGKKPNYFNEADFVIIGISRTTKTPLSMYLSNHGYKVANLPLVPEVSIPAGLFDIPKEKIFALIINPERLLKIRKERLKNLGLPEDSIYASLERIKDEMKYANTIVDKIGCKTIDVSSLSIEETADIIINTIKEVRKG